MDPHEVLFTLFGFKITLTQIFAIVGGTFGVALAVYRLIERWLTREARRLAMLREYLDKEEKDITARRQAVLQGIRLSEHAYLSEKNLDVGAEIDQAFDLLDRGYPEAATGKLAELEKRLVRDEFMLRRRADDLKKHTASVRIFLAALADRDKKPDIGLRYIDEALSHDQSDLDALKYKSILLLNKNELDNADRSFDKLRQRAAGKVNAKYRADAHLGLATTMFTRGPESYDAALQSLGTALTNMNSVPSAEQDHYTYAEIYSLQGNIYLSTGRKETDMPKAIQAYQKAMDELKLIPNRRPSIEAKMREIQAKIDSERSGSGSSNQQKHES
jgi:tetratricopeptide (TPR) repeat protein